MSALSEVEQIVKQIFCGYKFLSCAVNQLIAGLYIIFLNKNVNLFPMCFKFTAYYKKCNFIGFQEVSGHYNRPNVMFLKNTL